MSLHLRPARPEEAGALTELAVASKAHWGYSPEFLAGCREVLRIEPRRIRTEPHTVAEVGGQVVGFYSLMVGENAVLDKLFVSPEVIGQGVGRSLWTHLLAEVERAGYRELTWDADPHAEAFYRAMGAQTMGEAVSEVDPQRRLPLMRYGF